MISAIFFEHNVIIIIIFIRSKATVYETSSATPTLQTPPSNDSLRTDHDEAITYTTLKELCIQLADFREQGLPTGDWDQEGH